MSRKKLRILLLTSEFPPLNATGARRPYYLARQLRDIGHSVTVLTNERAEKDPWITDLDGIRCIALPLAPSTTDLNAWQRVLARFVHLLRRCGLSNSARRITDLLLPLDHGFRWGLRDASLVTLAGKQDVVIATGPRWSMFERAGALSKAFSAAFIADYRDPWNLVLPEAGIHAMTNVGKGLIGRLRRARRIGQERRIVANATAITAATPTVLENAKRATGHTNGVVILNGFEPMNIQRIPKTNKIFTIVYTGSAYREQEWSLLAASIELLRRNHPQIAATSCIQFIGTRANYDPHLAPLRWILEQTPLVQLIDRAAPDVVRSYQENANALLHVGFLNKQGILPLKLIEYLNAAPPIWQVSTGASMQEEVVLECRAGYILRSPKAIVDLWVEHHSAWNSGAPCQQHRDKEALTKYQWSHQMSRFALFMDEVYREHQKKSGDPATI